MTRAQAIEAGSLHDDDTKLIEQLRRQMTEATDERDNALLAIEYITAALDMPDGTELSKILARIEQLVEAEALAEAAA